MIEGARGAQAPPIERAERQGGLPLSFAQQRLWFLDQLEPGSPFYNNPVAVRLKGPLDVLRLEEALNALVRRHEALRTRFVAVDGKPVAVVGLGVAPQLGCSGAGRRHEQQARAEALEPFDLAAGPLIRARLLKVSPEEHIALVTLHHIISDGWSTGVFAGELSALYDAFAQDQPSPLPELPVQYLDFAIWQRKRLQGDVLSQQLEYWKEQLAGAPAILELPTDFPGHRRFGYRGAHKISCWTPG